MSGTRGKRLYVSIHFNSQDHDITDFNWIIIEKCRENAKFYRKAREVHWIETLNAVTPSGLNKKLQFGILWPNYQVERDTTHAFRGIMSMTSQRTPPQTPVPECNAVRWIFTQYCYCDLHNNRRDVFDAIDCVYSERNHVTVILYKFVVLIKACGWNINIEHKKRILIFIPCGILGWISINKSKICLKRMYYFKIFKKVWKFIKLKDEIVKFKHISSHIHWKGIGHKLYNTI